MVERVWAVEGCNGIGHHIAMRLLAEGEDVVDVPPKLSARAGVFVTGQGRKTDATDAHSVALVGTRMAGLRPVVNDEQLAVLGHPAQHQRTGPGGQRGNDSDSSATGSQAHTGSSDQSLPGPAEPHPRTPLPRPA